MTLQDKVPVEPIEFDRLERRIVLAAGPALARPRRPSLWPVGLALAGAAAGAIAMYALRPAPHAPPPQPIAVSTDDRGATLALGDASITASPATTYDVIRASGGIDVRLDHGAVRLDVAPRRDRPPLWVHAGDVGVRVVGTAFTVTRAPGDGEVSVEVEHGTVEVHKNNTIAPVTSGQRWSSRDGTVIAMAPNPPAPAAPGRTGAATGTSPATGVLTDRDRPTVAPGAGSASGRVTPRTGSRPGTGSGSNASAAEPDSVPAGTPGDLRSLIRGKSLAPAMSVPGTTPQERATELKKLGFSTDAQAGAALYGLARTQHVELGQNAQALKTLDAYFNRFRNKSAAEYEAALWLRLRILCSSSFTDGCRAAAHTYATAYPDSDPNSRGGIADRVKTLP